MRGDMNLNPVILAEAGIQADSMTVTATDWIPAFAGMTGSCL